MGSLPGRVAGPLAPKGGAGGRRRGHAPGAQGPRAAAVRAGEAAITSERRVFQSQQPSWSRFVGVVLVSGPGGRRPGAVQTLKSVAHGPLCSRCSRRRGRRLPILCLV